MVWILLGVVMLVPISIWIKWLGNVIRIEVVTFVVALGISSLMITGVWANEYCFLKHLDNSLGASEWENNQDKVECSIKAKGFYPDGDNNGIVMVFTDEKGNTKAVGIRKGTKVVSTKEKNDLYIRTEIIRAVDVSNPNKWLCLHLMSKEEIEKNVLKGIVKLDDNVILGNTDSGVRIQVKKEEYQLMLSKDSMVKYIKCKNGLSSDRELMLV